MDLKHIKFGYIKDKKDPRDLLYAVHPEMLKAPALPPLVDLRPKMSPIQNQGHLGSCVAHATNGNLEFCELSALAENQNAPEVFPDQQFHNFSRLHIYWNARWIDGTTDQDAGTQLRSAILAIRRFGICREDLWPYVESNVFNRPPTACYSEGSQHKVLFGYRLGNTIGQMKQCLAWGYPWIFGISVYSSFMSSDVAGSGVVPMPDPNSESLMGGHALCCVGYDDSQNMFIVRNSWGQEWGKDGYCYIPYAYLTDPSLCSDLWTLRKNSPNV